MAHWGDSRLPAQFWDKVSPCPMSGCWLWTGALNSMGYGNVGGKGWNALAHRLAYETLVARVPPDLVLDHRVCQTPSCCNPAHLEPVTTAENTKRAAALRTTCPNGHPWSEANTYMNKSGARQCRACGREHHRRYKEAKRAAL